MRGAVTGEQLLRRVRLIATLLLICDCQQKVLGRNVLIFEVIGFLERLFQKLVDLRRHGRLVRAAAGNFGQLVDFLVDLGEGGLGADANFLEHGRNDAFFVFDERGQEVDRHELGIAVLGGEFARALDSFLCFNCKFVPTDGHG